MPGIFISYRRSDSGMAAGRIHDYLSGRFGAPQVFMDVTATRPGEDFVEAIRSTVDKCDVMIAVIGQQWLIDETGQRRLDNPEDYVRQEIALALQKRIRVIPVLVDNATMPRQNELPPDLKKLAVQNGLPIRNESFKENMNFLIQTILDFRASAEPPLSPLENTAPFLTMMPPIPFSQQRRNQLIWVATLIALLPFNWALGSIPVMAGTITMAVLAPVAWPFARNMVLAAQIASAAVLVLLFGLNYEGIAPGNGTGVPYLCLGTVLLVTVINLIVVYRICQKSLFEMQPN